MRAAMAAWPLTTGASSSGSPIGERPTIRRLEPSSSSSTKAIYRSFGTAGVLLMGRIELSLTTPVSRFGLI